MAEPDRRSLLDEIELLEASLADAAAEAEAGELSAEDLEVIRQRDGARLAEARVHLADLGPEEPEREVEVPPALKRERSKGTKITALVTLLVLIVGAIALIVSLTSGPTTSAAEQQRSMLDQAATLVEQGKITDALKIYGQVLKANPTQAEALAQSGWLTFEAGAQANDSSVMAKGAGQVKAALAAQPRLAAAHLYLGVIYLVAAKDPNGALTEFQTFVDLKPNAALLAAAKPYLEEAAKQTGKPVPTAQS